MILIATGLKREARILAGPGVTVVAGGGDGVRLEQELDAAASRASAIISMGLCGALADGLAPGDWVVGTHLVPSPLAGEGVGGADGWGVRGAAATEADRFARNTASTELTPAPDPLRGPPSPHGGGLISELDPAWAGDLARVLKAKIGPILATGEMIATAEAKRAAYALTSAVAADMESHIAAAVAARHGLPFAVARVVSDAADRSLPKAAQAGMAADGSMDIAAVLAALARDPRQLRDLIRVGREAEIAFRALGRGRDLLGSGIGRADLG